MAGHQPTDPVGRNAQQRAAPVALEHGPPLPLPVEPHCAERVVLVGFLQGEGRTVQLNVAGQSFPPEGGRWWAQRHVEHPCQAVVYAFPPYHAVRPRATPQ